MGHRGADNISKPVLAIAALAAALVAGCQSAPPHPSATSKEQLPSGPSVRDPAASAQIHTELAAAYYQAGQFAAAQQVIVLALEANPQSPAALGLAGLIYGELRDAASAEAFFQRALGLAPRDPDLLHNHGAFLCKQGDHDTGMASLKRALQVPSYRKREVTLATLARCQMVKGDRRAALNNFTQALDANPDFYPALFGLAEVMLELGTPADARAQMKRYVQIAPPSPESLWLTYQIENALGNRADAQMVAQDLRQRFPSSPQARRLSPGQQ